MLKEDAAVNMLGEVRNLFNDDVSYFRIKRLDRTIENAAMYRGWTEEFRGG